MEARLQAAALKLARLNNNIAALKEDVRGIHKTYCHHGIRLDIHRTDFEHHPNAKVKINQTEVFFCLPGRRGWNTGWYAKIHDDMLSAIEHFAIECLILQVLEPTGMWTLGLSKAGTNASQACNDCRNAGRLLCGWGCGPRRCVTTRQCAWKRGHGVAR